MIIIIKRSIKYFFLFLTLLLFQSCEKEKYQIIYTVGLEDNPKALRYGLELTNDKVYYCIENTPKSGKYSYYYCDIDYKTSFRIKEKVCQNYQSSDTLNRKKHNELIIINSNGIKTVNYPRRVFDLQDFLKLRHLKMTQINYHDFPKELLEEKRPKFIPPDSLILTN